MSHLTTIETIFKDIESLGEAAKALDLMLMRGGTARYWAGQSGPCDYVLRLPGRYDLGFTLNTDGTYKAVCDNELLSGSFGAQDTGRKMLGDNLARLKQEYAAAVAMKQARMRGAYASRQVRNDGAVVVTIRG